jgi:isopentenyl-diphosphate Delta-isomerase
MQDMMTLVDENDNVLGPISKLNGHLLLQNNKQVVGNGPQSHMLKKSELHRAFSLLLFNSKNELLMQQRAFKKITFPGRWTNTCCSHNAHIPLELEAEPQFVGMRRAAVRRTDFELGIKDLKPDDLSVVSRILYYAESCDRFAEHELDYIIFARKDIDLGFMPNPDEIEEIAWVKYHDFSDFLQEQ